ncbi:MAG TPA: hypothetical protein DCE41_30815 [Cytophagales bacterium]|nr:hypothetical protein [Cytophagales bacterium]
MISGVCAFPRSWSSVVLVLGCLLGTKAVAQNSNNPSYAEDFRLLRYALETAHPSLYRFHTPAEFEDAFDSLGALITPDTKGDQFFRYASFIMSMVEEGHSDVGISEKLEFWAIGQPLFPFQVWVGEDQMLATSTEYSGYDAYVGQEIVTINGRTIRQINHALTQATSGRSGSKNLQGQLSMLSLADNFAQSYFLFLDTARSFEVQFRDPATGALLTDSVSGITRANPHSYPYLPEPKKPPVTSEFNLEEGTAYLRIDSFAWWVINYSRRKYARDFRDFFRRVEQEQIAHVIIDVRNNRGGEELIWTDLVGYLTNEPFKIYNSLKTRTTDLSLVEDLPQVQLPNYWEPELYEATDSGYFKQEDEILGTFAPQKKYRFTGNVYVLGNGRSWSAASSFLGFMKTNQLGTLIGQESGGALGYVDGRKRLTFTLPRSQSIVSFPLWSMQLPYTSGDPDRGVLPDLEVTPNFDDLLSGRDVELETVHELIRQMPKAE